MRLTRSEEEVADGVILDDEAVMARLRSMPNIRQMDWSRVLHCVMTASAMSRVPSSRCRHGRS